MKWNVIAVTVMALALGATGAHAAGGDPMPRPTPKPNETPNVSAEDRYNNGLERLSKRDWLGAEQAFRDAIALKPDMPEAWNELGHTLKNEKRFDESIAAYTEALRLRPNYPQALEYLGEAYVAMGKMAEAHAVLDRLRPLDEQHAQELAKAILSGTTQW